MQTQKVLEIFRSRTLEKTFFLLINNELKKVKKELYPKILKGYVYKNDLIRVTEDDELNGIDFEVVDDDFYKEIECKYEYLDFIYYKWNLLPFLTDILPYYNTEIQYNTGIPNKNMLVGTVLYKTRINHSLNKYYLFYIIEANKELIKGMVWKENFKYSSLKVYDTIIITKYRNNKGYKNTGHIENNEFSELSYFNTKEITITELYKYDKKQQISHKFNLFENVSGYIKYRSVLNRYFHNTYHEYYLLDVDNKKIMLFYNSDRMFYEIEAGNMISISNLKKITRFGFTFYISTIYTQFEYEVINEMNEECSSFLYEHPISKNKVFKRNLDEETKSLNEESESSEQEESVSISEDNVKRKKNMQDVEISEDYDINQEDIAHLLNDNSLTINLELSAIPNASTLQQPNSFYVESGYGFLPDNITNFSELGFEDVEVIDGVEYVKASFQNPKKISILDLEGVGEALVINQTEKYICDATIKEVDYTSYEPEGEDEYCISYIDTNQIKKQYPIRVIVDNNIELFIFGNFFTDKTGFKDLINVLPKDCINKKYTFLLNVFRASEMHVVYSISGIIETKY